MIKFTYQQTINILIALGLTSILSAFKINAYILYLSCIAFYIIIYIITLHNDRKRVRGQNIMKESYVNLIDECNRLEIDLANQVKATDECERLLVNQAEKNTLEKAGQVKVNIPHKYATSDEILDNMPNDTTSISSLDKVQTSVTTVKQDLPFATIPPYIGQEVTVRYGGQIVTAPITNILEKEKGVRYKVKGTGRREYKIDEMEVM